MGWGVQNEGVKLRHYFSGKPERYKFE